jgi:Lhr-like helicase
VRPIEGPLDVLAQVILSMVVAEPWDLDELHAALKTSYPYRRLQRRQFDLVIDMLAGRYASSRIRELRPRLTVDRVANVVVARPGAARLLYMAGGTIADRGYFAAIIKLQDHRSSHMVIASVITVADNRFKPGTCILQDFLESTRGIEDHIVVGQSGRLNLIVAENVGKGVLQNDCDGILIGFQFRNICEPFP